MSGTATERRTLSTSDGMEDPVHITALQSEAHHQSWKSEIKSFKGVVKKRGFPPEGGTPSTKGTAGRGAFQ